MKRSFKKADYKFNFKKDNLYNKCVVVELGAAAASILSQNLERQGFFREAERKEETESEKDNEKQKEREIDRQRER